MLVLWLWRWWRRPPVPINVGRLDAVPVLSPADPQGACRLDVQPAYLLESR